MLCANSLATRPVSLDRKPTLRDAMQIESLTKRFHLAGGESFLNIEEVLQLLQVAKGKGATPAGNTAVARHDELGPVGLLDRESIVDIAQRMFTPIIDEVLKADEKAPPKQRHTAAQIFRRLRDEHGYAGGYDQVRRYVGRHRRETFIPLVHDPGQRLECDFGHIYVDFPRGTPTGAGTAAHVGQLLLP